MNPRHMLRALFSSSIPWGMPEETLQAFVAEALTIVGSDAASAAAINGAIVQAETATLHVVDRSERLAMQVVDRVAVIPIHGVLSRFSTSPFAIQELLAEAVRSSKIRGIVLDVDSPGGSVAGIEDTANQIFNARRAKPVIVAVRSLAASAAYWLASQADRILIGETGQAANIGVYTVLVDWSAFFGAAGVRVEVVRRGEFKGAGVVGTPIIDSQKVEFRRIVQRIGDVFVRHVARGRGMTLARAEALSDGRLWVGMEAVDRGVADAIGTVEDAIAMAVSASAGPRPSNAAFSNANIVASTNAATQLRRQLDPGWNPADEIAYRIETPDGSSVVAATATGAPAPSITERNPMIPDPTLQAGPAAPAAVATAIVPVSAPVAPASPVPGAVAPVAPVATASPVPGAVAPVAPAAPASPVPGAVAPVAPAAPASPVPAVGVAPAAPLAPGVLAVERARATEIAGIGQALGFEAKWVTDQIAAGSPIEDIRKGALDRVAAARAPQPVQVGADLNIDSLGPAMMAALQIGAGEDIKDPPPRAQEFIGRDLCEMARCHLVAYGHPNPQMLNRVECARAVFHPNEYMSGVALTGASTAGLIGHTTSDFPTILEGSINATLQRAYDENPGSWDRVFRKAPARDFRDIKRLKLSGFGVLPKVDEGEEYSQATLAEGKEVYVVGKYGHLFVISWESLVNDDHDAFGRIPRMQGLAARRVENRVAWTPFVFAVDGATMDDGKKVFHADHNNLAAVPAALTVASLSIGRQAIREQTDLNGVELALVPTFLVVPPALETIAEKLITSETDPAAAAAGIRNVMRGKFELVIENQLGVAGGRVGKSDTAWYLLANTAQVDTVEVAHLIGHERPFLERKEGHTTDGRSYKIRFVVGAAAIDHRGLFKNAGV